MNTDEMRMNPRALRMTALEAGPQACQSCRTVSRLRSLDLEVHPREAKNGRAADPGGYCPLVALCDECWLRVCGEILPP